MDLGIIGLSAVGKTSLFNALTGGEAQVGVYSSRNAPNVGSVDVPDERLDRLAAMTGSKRVTYAEIRWVDYPTTAFDSTGPDPKLLQELIQMDALVIVVRAFQDPTVPLPETGIDAGRDIETVQLELAYTDLALIERRLERIEPELRSLPAAQRGQLEQDKILLGRLKDELERGGGLRGVKFSESERRGLTGYQFATRRPLMIVVNVGESELPQAEEIEADYADRYGGSAISIVVLSAKLEAELAQMKSDEAAEFRRELALPEASPLDRFVRETYALLGVHSFLTVGEQEARAWTLPQGGTALEAARCIHSDIERGFIRAEVSRWDELLAAGSEAALRKQGLLHTEGREYVVKDGDVLHVLFNV